MTFTRLVRQLFESLRTVWLVLGVTLAFLFVLELCVRVTHYVAERQRARRLAAVPASLRDPQESEPWFADFTREYDATRPQRWKSYVYFGRKPSFKGRYVNIDADGHRVTPQPSSPAEPAARVFFMGGSTMWGTEQRDSATIAAVAAQRLQGLAGPAGRIEVTNFGESGYVNTQELLELMLALRAGKRPDVVVFYDGINDVGTTVQYGVAGIPQNESKRVAEFDLGRAIDRSGFAQGMGKVGDRLRNVALALVRIIRRLLARSIDECPSAFDGGASDIAYILFQVVPIGTFRRLGVHRLVSLLTSTHRSTSLNSEEVTR